ncbi:Protein kinase C alpha type [Gracilariopsis chorda]|uniref:Protein kinase C alpha type n=1 Tax=Gracilariopsis chorda TaxID=448386 RepID=A0A2V3J1Z6_9FLOR|nr:Protein kinase C alpha type [Gracilariopsis chorda]|eukprot:PXF48389.1 Protein kinase C alpha type [Gracilariopsis chorda]
MAASATLHQTRSLPRAPLRQRPAPAPAAPAPPTIPPLRRSLNLRTRLYRAPTDRVHHDALSLLERIPPTLTASALVKCARHPLFARSDRLWLELRSTLVLLTADSAHFVGLFSLHACSIRRSANAPVLKICRAASSHCVCIRFDDDHTAAIWHTALNNATTQRNVAISDFEFISPIGKGASAKVFLVADRKTGQKLALKVLDKARVFESKTALRHALHERLALQMVDGHPFFSRLKYAFQTRTHLYLAIHFYDGGDLHQYLTTHSGRLSEPQVKSVAAQVLLALEHLHSLGFVYRDLKPENVLLDSHGHVRLADFGLCKFLPDTSLTNTICGTHTYAAPEMLSVRNYGKSVDLWAFGVFVYHMLRGRTPYEARELDQVIANMNNRRIRFSSSTSGQLVNMVKRLLDWNPDTRLGCGPSGCAQVREHPFFHGTDWHKVLSRQPAGTALFADSPRSSASDGIGATGPSGAHRDTSASPPPPPPPSANLPAAAGSCAAALAANQAGETPSTLIMTDEYAHMDALDEGATHAMGAARGASGVSDGALRAGTDAHSRGAHTSLRERMKAACAVQDDLRNFDMREWGKISVDQDYDDVEYGDHALWPVARARRKVLDDEWLIVGYAYCSAGPDDAGEGGGGGGDVGGGAGARA